MRLTQQQIESLSAAELAEYFRQEARQEIAERKQERENAAKFQSIARPHILAGRDFDGFMAAEQCPASFRSAYERLQTKYRAEHQPSPEQIEREQLENEVQAAMGLSSDPQQQAEPTGYQGADYVSSWARYAQTLKDRERRRFGGIGGTASESPAEPDDPEEPDSEEPDSEPDDPTPDNPTPDNPDSEPSDPAEDDPAEDDPNNDTPSEG